MTDPFAGAASRYEHPDYLDEPRYATLTPDRASLDLLDLSDERGLVRTADVLRPLFAAWADDPGAILPYPVADPRWQATLARVVLDGFGGGALPTSAIVFGDGTYELFKELAGFVLRKGVLLGAGPVYPEFAGYFVAAGGRFRALCGADGAFPAAALHDALDREPAAVAIYADLPYNATGGLPERAEALEVVEHAARRDVAVIFDEAYRNFLGRTPSFVEDVAVHPNLLVLRSLSKGFDLRGLRFGFAVLGARWADVVRRVRSPYAPSQPSARAALRLLTEAPDVVRPLTDAIGAAKARVVASATRAGLTALSSHPHAPNLMLRSPHPGLADRCAALGLRVARGSQFAFTTGGALDDSIRFRTPLAPHRLAALDAAFARL